jgi:hypothetical protein
VSQIGQIIAGNPFSLVQTLTGNVGGPVPPTAGNINVIGAGDVTVTGNPGLSTLTITISGAVATTFNEDVGSATPLLNNISVVGGTSAGGIATNINTIGAGNIIQICLNNNISLPNTNGAATAGIYLLGGTRFIHNFGATNTFIGSGSGNTTLTGFSTTGIGAQVLQSLTTGAFNTAGGFLSQGLMTSGTNNASWGAGSLGSAVGATVVGNTAIGNGALNTATGPIGNTVLGFLAGSSYTTNESNNIIIGNTGTVADTNRIRIGTNGTHTSCFVTGIYGVNVGSVATIVSVINTDQLGQTAIVAGSGITVTPGANTITISSTGADLLAYTNVNTTPYIVLSTDEYLGVDCSGAPIQINLPNAPSTGRVFNIKDRTGNANINNITVTTVGGVVNIDGATTYVMNTQYAAINVLFDGTTYQVW